MKTLASITAMPRFYMNIILEEENYDETV